MDEPKLDESTQDPLPLDYRGERGASALRIKIAFMVFTGLVVTALTGLQFQFVSRIFGELTPSIARDLENKALRGSADIARAAELGIVLHDVKQIRGQLSGYELDEDILAIVVVDAEGNPIAQFGPNSSSPIDLFSGPKGQLSRRDNYVSAWAPAEIEASPIGKVGLVVSTGRLLAGRELEQKLLIAAAIAAVAALVAALGFVSFYVGPLLHIIERAFKRLQHTTAAALEAARLKGEFLANMSHEIRTPMNGVLGMIELLSGTNNIEKQKKYVSTLDSSARALMAVLNDILDFSKIEAGKLRLNPTPCSVRTVIEDVAELFAMRAHTRGLELTCHVQPEVPEVVTMDGDRLRQVLANLVGNAIKFTESGQIVVRARAIANGTRLRCEVVDTGIGIAPEAQRHLFEAFTQADGSATRKFGGTGLGLTISRQLVELMGGQLSVTSKLGTGSTFWFELPIEECQNSTAPASQRPERTAKALIVDDNDTNRVVLEELLAHWGFQSKSAPDARSALSALDQAARDNDPFGLVLSDFHMPDVDGLGLARAIAANPGKVRPHFVLLTSVDHDAELEASSAIIDGYLQKPIRSRDLMQTINRVLKTETAEKAAPILKAEQQAHPEAAPPLAAPALQTQPLLVVDDNPINQIVMIEHLELLGYQVDVAGDGAEALVLMERNGYPMVFMDCQMPVMDGYAATAEWRRREKGGPRTPIVAVTAHAIAGERDKVLAAGMDDYLSKPVSSETLQAALARWWPHARGSAVAPLNTAPTLSKASSRSISASPAVIEAFARNAPSQTAAILEAVAAGDLPRLKQETQKMKGSLLALGAQDLAQLCVLLETNPLDSLELGERLRTEVTNLTIELETPTA